MPAPTPPPPSSPPPSSPPPSSGVGVDGVDRVVAPRDVGADHDASESRSDDAASLETGAEDGVELAGAIETEVGSAVDAAADDAHSDETHPRDDIVDVTAGLQPDGVDRVRAAEHGRHATAPHRIPLAGWKDIALRIKDEWGDDHVGMAAAAVAFYSFLALIPALAATVSILGLVSRGREPERVIEQIFGALPDDATSLLTSQLESISAESPGAFQRVGM